MKKIIVFLSVLILSFTMFATGCAGCGPDDDGGKKDVIVPKPVDGSAILFDEGMDFYNVEPSVIDEGGNRYIFYSVNEVAKENKSAVAVRKATKSEDKWVYGDKTLVLTAGESGFDMGGVSDPDVIKGNFTYNGNSYAYLMAYEGAPEVGSDKNHKIGFAVSGDLLSGWVKVEGLVFSAENAAGYGLSQPSLINYDKQNKIILCYSVDRGAYTVQALREIGAANLSEPVIGIENVLTEKGLKDNDGNGFTTFNNADFAYDSESGYLYVVRDRNPAAAQGCKLITAVQVNKILLTDLFTADAKWEIVKETVKWKDLLNPEDEESMGWAYVYSACIASDVYGFVDNATALDLALTVTSYDENTFDYLYYQTITECRVSL